MHDGLQALNAMVEASKTAGDRVKSYFDDRCKDLQDKLLYVEVYQQHENLHFFGIGEKSRGKEDTHSVLQEFLVRVLEMQQEVLKIEFRRMHRVKKTNVDGRPRAIIARFLRYQDRELMKVKCDHRSKFSNLNNWKEEAWKKKNQGFNVEALIFFRLLLSNCLNWKIYCDDHTSLSSTTAVQI